MQYRLAIFDFDGTLADSYPFFVTMFDQLALKHGFKPVTREEAAELRHRDPRDVMRHVGMPAWKLPRVARDFVDGMRQQAHTIPRFPGIDETLAELARAGVQLAVVSSNAEDNVRAVLGAANADLFTQYECGMSIFGKASRIRNVIKRAKVASHESIYIADQLSDLDAATEAGVPFGAVAWGYGTAESMQAKGAAQMFQHVHELVRIA